MAVQKHIVVKPTSTSSVLFPLCALASLTACVPVSAATLTVDDNYPKETAQKFQTIQSALQAAAPGDKIVVAPGVYHGPIAVSKTVTITGAGAGTIPSGPQNNAAQDSIVVHDGGSGFDVTASDVTISGFTIQGNPSALDYPNAGIFVRTGSNRTLNFNVLEDNGLGIYVEGNQQGLILKNSAFLDNGRTFNPLYIPAGGLFAFGGLVNNATIQNNYFTGNDQFSLNFGDGSSGGLQITDNESENESTFLVIGHTSGARVVNNNVANMTRSAILCFGQNTGMLIAQNTLVGGSTNVGNGIRLTMNYGATAGDANTIIRNNTVSDFGLDGISLNKVSGATVTNNVVLQNGEDGIRLQDAVGSSFLNNDANHNGRDGIRAEAPSIGNTIKKNSLYDNTEFDAYDETGNNNSPANVWNMNVGVKQNRAGLLG